MLTGSEIKNKIHMGDILISPYDSTKIGPNSYDLEISNKLIEYGDAVIDARKEPEGILVTMIEESGTVLMPGHLYIGSTVEKVGSSKYVPVLHGRSTAGRLGISIHITAGLGDIGWYGEWTLEMSVVRPVRIYPGMSLCQVVFEEVTGDTGISYKGKYQWQSGPTPFRLKAP